MFWRHDQHVKSDFFFMSYHIPIHSLTKALSCLCGWLDLDMLTSLMAHKKSKVLCSRKDCPPLDASKNSNTPFILQSPELHAVSKERPHQC